MKSITTYKFSNPDLHLHSSHSDGTDTPRVLLDRIRRAGIDVFSLTDHDTVQGCQKMRQLLGEDGPYFIDGVEFSCKDEGGKYHILGYAYDFHHPAMQQAASFAHHARIEKNKKRLDYLEEAYGFFFDEEERKWLFSMDNPGKPHLVSLMETKGYIKQRKEGFELLASYSGGDAFLTPEKAIDAILKADGIPILAHGCFGSGTQRLSREELEHRIKRLKEMGILGLECFYSGYSHEQTEQMLHLKKKFSLLATGGSDYHGGYKTVELGQINHLIVEELHGFFREVFQRKRYLK